MKTRKRTDRNSLRLANRVNRLTREELATAKIFIIDDEPIVLAVYEEYFKSVGLESIFAFTDPVEAIENLRYVKPDVILTDIHMPEVSGKFLIKLLRTYDHLKHVPIIAITSDTSEKTTADVRRNGADKILHKPVDSPTIVGEIKSVLIRARQLRRRISEDEHNRTERQKQRKARMLSVESNLRDLLR